MWAGVFPSARRVFINELFCAGGLYGKKKPDSHGWNLARTNCFLARMFQAASVAPPLRQDPLLWTRTKEWCDLFLSSRLGLFYLRAPGIRLVDLLR